MSNDTAASGEKKYSLPDGIPVINYKNSTDQILAIFWFEKLENIYVVFFIQP